MPIGHKKIPDSGSTWVWEVGETEGYGSRWLQLFRNPGSEAYSKKMVHFCDISYFLVHFTV